MEPFPNADFQARHYGTWVYPLLLDQGLPRVPQGDSLGYLRVCDWLCTVGFAISGALTASASGMDLFGVCFVAMATAIGGGTLRDTVLFCKPTFWLIEIEYLVMSVVSALLVFFAWKHIPGGARGLWLKKDNSDEEQRTSPIILPGLLPAMATTKGNDAEDYYLMVEDGAPGSKSSDASNETPRSRSGSFGEFKPPQRRAMETKREEAHRRKTAMEQRGEGNPQEGPLLWWVDSLGLGAFTAVGVRNAAILGCHPLVLILAGPCTACGGGVIRDVFCGLPLEGRHVGRVMGSLTKPMYVAPALISATLYTLLLLTPMSMGFPGRDPWPVGCALTVLLRLTADRMHLRLPQWS